jgi:hypothetical protein
LRFAAIARYYLVSRARTGHVAALAARLHGLPITEKTSIEMAVSSSRACRYAPVKGCHGRYGFRAQIEWFSIRPYRLLGSLFVGGRAAFEGCGSQAVSTAPEFGPLAGPFRYAGLVHHRKMARG